MWSTRRWEYWASSTDAGWGAWSIESGWTQSWITSVLALRQMNTSLWDLTRNSRIKGHFPRLRAEMFPDLDSDAAGAGASLNSGPAALKADLIEGDGLKTR